ncbi:hypothetical protein BD770DRAFT_413887 [Pilaira anomala]|nr:hypothetical protein BD770DRAFT_413887 [Pilaira anomala]
MEKTDVISSVILRCTDDGIVDIKKAILEVEEEIIKYYPAGENIDDYLATWLNNAIICAKNLTLQISNSKPLFKSIRQKLIATPPTDKKISQNLPRKTNPEEDGSTLSVEQKLFKYGLKCHYLHPIHSYILDLGDETLKEIFSEQELLEMQEFGLTPLLHPMDVKIENEINKMENMNILQIYNYYRKLDFNPVLEPMITWLKEKASTANRSENNSKRKLSSVEEMTRKVIGRKMNSVYIGAELELGAAENESRGKEYTTQHPENGNKKDDTKNLSDGYLKLPIVMKDMLKNIVENYPEIRNEVNIIGYNVQGNLLTYLNMDTPAGYVSRIRRLRKLPYPTSQADYVSRMPALLRISYNGFETMNSTLKKIQSLTKTTRLQT